MSHRSNRSTSSTPPSPNTANQSIMRRDLDTMQDNLRNLTDIVNTMARNIERLTPPPYPYPNDPNRAGPSRTFGPPTPPIPSHFEPLPPYRPPPRDPNHEEIPPPPPPPPYYPPPRHQNFEDPPPPPPPGEQEDLEDDRVSYVPSIVNDSHDRRHRRREDDDRGLKLDLPEFEGSLNPDDFLDWISAIERVFDYKEYSEEKKFRLAVLKFKGYASLWWDDVRRQRERENRRRIREWTKLKSVMEKRLLPKEYKHELYQKLHNLKQDKKTVTEYIREFENLKIRCDVPEEREHTVVRLMEAPSKMMMMKDRFFRKW